MGFGNETNSWSVIQDLLLITSCLCLEFTFAIDSIRVNQSIRDSEVLVSNGQTCKLSFFSPINSSNRYVGVMYNVPVLTVIWVANRDNPLNDTAGTVAISEDGNLVVLDGQKGIVWSSNLSNPVANSSVRLLDTGNLVLQNNLRGGNLWESFQHASDSFLQRMRLITDLSTNKRNLLTSWRSVSDPAFGSFTASMELQELPQVVVRNGSDPYWRSGPWNGQIFIGISGMRTNLYKDGLTFVYDNPETAYLTFINSHTSFLAYFVLNTSGILQEKFWFDGNKDWDVMWSSINSECDVYGKCGPFGSCNSQATPICTCLPGFEPKNVDEWSAANWTSGCTRRTPLQCEKNNSVGEMTRQDGFFRLNTVKLPDGVKWSSTREADCGSRCLNNCSCIAYSYYAGIGCMLWTES